MRIGVARTVAARRVDRRAGDLANARSPMTGGPPSIGSPRPLQTRPASRRRPESASGARERHAQRRRGACPTCPRAPRPPRGRDRRRARRRGARSPLSRRISADLVPADAVDPLDDEQRPADRPRRDVVLDRGARRQCRASERGRASSIDAASTASASSGRGLVARPDRRAEKSTCLDRRRAATPRSTSSRQRSCDVEHEPQRARPAWPARRRRRSRSVRSAAAPPRAGAAPRAASSRSRSRAATPRRRARRSPRSRSASASRASARVRRARPARIALARMPAGERLGVAGERVAPADRGIVARVGEVAVERPDAAHERVACAR